MIKKYLFAAVFATIACGSVAQNAVQVNGDIFSISLSDEDPLFYDQSGVGLSLVDGPGLVFAANTWATGYDKNGSLRGVVGKYRASSTESESGYNPGTINTDPSKASASLVAVTAGEIENHISDYLDPNYEMPGGISDWPANGDTTIGEMWQMAPFVDLNENGVYEPEEGDYPNIIGEECIYLIKNDLGPDFPRAIGMELHYMISMFDVNVELSNVLDNTVLINTTLYNRGDAELDTLQVATWIDADLGWPADDYVSSREDYQAMVMYNGDNNDESVGSFQGFGNNPPALAFGSMFCDLWGGMYMVGRDPEQAKQDPISFDEHHFYSKAVWRDTTCLIDINAGHVSYTSSTDTYNATRFVYSDLPGSEGWTEATANREPGERKVLPIHLPKRFYPNDKISYTLALHLAGNPSNTASENAVLAYQRLQPIENLLLERYGDHPLIQASTNCATVPVDRRCDPSLSIEDLEPEPFKVFPNPSSGQVYLTGVEQVRELFILNSLGQQLKHVIPESENKTLTLPPGHYVLHAIMLDGKARVEKVIVY